jgi:hypothetical protein
MPELSQVLLDHGASLEARDREGFTLLMQAVLSMEAAADRDRMVRWLLSKGVDPNATNDRGETAYQLAARMESPALLDLLVKAGAKEIREQPAFSGGALPAPPYRRFFRLSNTARPCSRAAAACPATIIPSPR